MLIYRTTVHTYITCTTTATYIGPTSVVRRHTVISIGLSNNVNTQLTATLFFLPFDMRLHGFVLSQHRLECTTHPRAYTCPRRQFKYITQSGHAAESGADHSCSQ